MRRHNWPARPKLFPATCTVFQVLPSRFFFRALSTVRTGSFIVEENPRWCVVQRFLERPGSGKAACSSFFGAGGGMVRNRRLGLQSTPLTPHLPVPRRIALRVVSQKIRRFFLGRDSKGLAFADSHPSRTSVFDDSTHRSYNARVYFGRSPGPGALALDKWRIRDAERGKDAQQAYDDFLRGLEVAGCQELLDATARHQVCSNKNSKEVPAAALAFVAP